jgi:hypothetical protein
MSKKKKRRKVIVHNIITDGCNLGISSIISQGADWQTAEVAAFYLAKLNSAQ